MSVYLGYAWEVPGEKWRSGSGKRRICLGRALGEAGAGTEKSGGRGNPGQDLFKTKQNRKVKANKERKS